MKNCFLSAVMVCALLTVTVMTAAPASAAWPYPDYASFIASFKALATSYPQYVSYETIGKTVLNQDLLMFRIGNPAGGVVLFDGAIHGWESEGSQLLYYYARWLLTSGDALASHALARTCTLLVPAVNTDDYSLSRKNAHGVDLNRNFATNWQSGGSTNPKSEYYRGPSPLSEPESQAMVRVFQNRRPDAYINVHDGGGEIVYPNSYYNSTYRSTVFSKISSLSAQRGVATYATTVINGPGYSTSDAARAGARTSLIFEIGNGTRTLPEVISSVLPRFIPYAIILSQESENHVLVTRVSKIKQNIVDAAPNKTYFIQTRNPYDAQGNGYAYSTCQNAQYLRMKDDPQTVTQTGTNSGKPTFTNMSIVLFGGPRAHTCTEYYERNGQTPLVFTETAYGQEKWGFTKNNGETIPNACMNMTQFNDHTDLFTVETFIDDSNNFVAIMYGITQYGTLAAGPYFKDTILPSISNYTQSWYIFKWTDGTNGQPFDFSPQPNEISLVAQGS